MQPAITNASHPLIPLLQKLHDQRNLAPLNTTLQFKVEFISHSLVSLGDYMPWSTVIPPPIHWIEQNKVYSTWDDRF